MPKVNKKFSYLKCGQCRKDKQKCLPVSRVWPDRCDRCKKYCYTCSLNTSTTHSTKTTSENAPHDVTPSATHGTSDRLPHDSMSNSDPRRQLVDIEFLTELTEESTPEGNLHFAVKRRAIKLIRWLLSYGVEVDSRVNGVTALYEAVRCEFDDVVELLLNQGADVSKVDGNGMNPLHLAASQGQAMTVKLLLHGSSGAGISARERTASIKAYDDRDLTPVHHAVLSYDEESIRLLLEAGADVNEGEEDFDPPLYTAVNCESPLRIVQCLLDHGASASAVNSDKQTPIHIAVKVATKEIVGLLLKCVSDTSTVNMQDLDGRTALHYAIMCDDNDEIVALLLDADASVSITDCYNQTPLHWAAGNGSETSIRLLLRHFKQTSDLDIQTKLGRTALHYALENPAAESIVTLLLEAGASVSIVDEDNETPLHGAAWKGDVNSMRLLLDHVKQKSDVDIQNVNGSTALHFVLWYRDANYELMTLLLEAGASVSIRNEDSETPIQRVVRNGSEKSMRLLLNHVKQPSELNIQNVIGSTALQLAIKYKSVAKVKMLLKSGADFNAGSVDGCTALDLALESEEEEIRKLAVEFVRVNEWRAETGALFSPEDIHIRSLTDGSSKLDHPSTGQTFINPNNSILPSYGDLNYTVASEFHPLQEATNQFPYGLYKDNSASLGTMPQYGRL